MFYCKDVNKTNEIKRKGTAEKVIVTADGDCLFSAVTYNKKKKALVVDKGGYIVCLCKEVGIREQAEVELTMVSATEMLVTLLSGAIYVRSELGHIVKLTTFGKAIYISEDEDIYWFNRTAYRSYATVRLAKEYNVPMDSKYVDKAYEYDLTYLYRMYYDTEERVFRATSLGFRQVLGNENVPKMEGKPAWTPPKPTKPKRSFLYN